MDSLPPLRSSRRAVESLGVRVCKGVGGSSDGAGHLGGVLHEDREP